MGCLTKVYARFSLVGSTAHWRLCIRGGHTGRTPQQTNKNRIISTRVADQQLIARGLSSGGLILIHRDTR